MNEKRKLYAEQVRLLYENVLPSSLATLACSSLLVIVLWKIISPAVLISWLAVLLLVTSLRYLLVLSYNRTTAESRESEYWGGRMILAIAAVGLAWGLSGIFLFPEESVIHQVFLVFVSGGMIIGALGSYSVNRSAFPAFAIPASLLLIIRTIIWDNKLGMAMGVMELVFVVVILLVSRKIYAAIERSLRLQYENIALIANLTDAKETLWRSEEQFRAIFETARDAIYIKDRDLRYIKVNPALEKIFGLPGEKMIGRTADELFGKETGAHVREVDRRVLNGEIVEDEDSKPVQGDGRIYHFCKVPMHDEHGLITGLFGIARDITDWKRMESELFKSRKLESLGVLAGGIAHDFNNILTIILGNISFVRTKMEKDSKLFKALSGAVDACLRAKGLTQQLLTFSRGGNPVKSVFELGDLLESTVKFVLHGSNVNARFEVADDLWPVEADRGQIGQVFSNLVINANQAMSRGGEIRLAATNIDLEKNTIPTLGAGQYVKVEVEDWGVGIPQEYLKNIFDPYFSTKQSGSGLGLATVYSIMRNHSGAIQVESEPGKGTTFTVYLKATKKKIEMIEGNQRVVTGEGKVLLMDDEEKIRDLGSLVIAELGYEVEAVADGEEAVKKFRSARDEGNPFVAVILDLTVKGGMGGVEALRRLKDITPDIKAIISSGYSNDSVMADYESSGFAGVISKPYSIEKMSRALGMILKDCP